MISANQRVVLVADDEPAILLLVCRALVKQGYAAIAAANAQEALQACKQHSGPIHLALLDVTMPGMSGPELFRHLQKLYPNVSVIFMSGYASDLIEKEAPELREASYIQKPFLLKEVVDRVNEVLEVRHP